MDVEDLYAASGDDAVVLDVHVQPGAGRIAVVGRHGAALKVRVGASPQAGRANEACVALLRDTFSATTVDLVGGSTSRAKRFRLTGLDLGEFRRRLALEVGEGASGAGPDRRPTGRN